MIHGDMNNATVRYRRTWRDGPPASSGRGRRPVDAVSVWAIPPPSLRRRFDLVVDLLRDLLEPRLQVFHLSRLPALREVAEEVLVGRADDRHVLVVRSRVPEDVEEGLELERRSRSGDSSAGSVVGTLPIALAAATSESVSVAMNDTSRHASSGWADPRGIPMIVPPTRPMPYVSAPSSGTGNGPCRNLDPASRWR